MKNRRKRDWEKRGRELKKRRRKGEEERTEEEMSIVYNIIIVYV